MVADVATTTLGTPASAKWDFEWLAEVDRTEQELGRQICGAHTPAWTPCTLVPSHPNGRCRFHGGAPGIGAPNGNRNAWVHGLYSRRLQQCGDHCPLWNHCPMAGNDVLELRPGERPHCVYEQDEYDIVLQSVADQSGLGFQPKHEAHETNGSSTVNAGVTGDANAHKHGLETRATDVPLCASASPREPTLIERNVALFQVMLSRAQAALRISSLTDEFTARTDTYQTRSVRVSALVQAQLHIARELRQWLKLLPGFDPSSRQRTSTRAPKPPEPERELGLPDLMKPLMEETGAILEEAFGPNFLPGGAARFARKDPPPATA